MELLRGGPRAAAPYLKLPKLLQFFTGNIGLHHVHHLSAKIPNYNLQPLMTRTRSFTRCRC